MTFAPDAMLPGQRQPQPGMPNVRQYMNGPITLEAFKLVDSGTSDWGSDFASRFVLAMLARSFDRRLAEGPNGLIFEASQLMIRHMLPAVVEAYRERNVVARMPQSTVDDVANELASEMMRHRELREEVEVMLQSACDVISNCEAWTKIEDGGAEQRMFEKPKAMLKRILDYCDGPKRAISASDVIDLQRMIMTCLRVSTALSAA